LEAAMDNALNGESPPTAVELLDAAERLLERVLASDCESRSSAFDLLTVDALLTQALQVDASGAVANVSFADEAIRRLALRARL
jgi:hypothetical protein